MKLRKTLKIFLSCLLILIMLIPNCVQASNPNFNPSGFENGSDTSEISQKATNIMGAALSIMRVVGTGVAIIMLIVVASKYMIAAPGERAEIKKHAVPYVVGAVVLFASSGILGIITKFALTIK